MQAIILAAGMGKRLKDLTQNNTKCMIRVDGVTLIERMLRQIEAHGISRVIIVTGYKGQELKEYISTLDLTVPIIYVDNPVYDRTNNIYSLYLAREWMIKEDTLLFESDLIFEDSVIDELLDDPRESLALVDKYEAWMDGTCIKLGADDRIVAFVSGKELDYKETSEYYKTVNIYKFSSDFSHRYYVPFLEAYRSALGENEYYEQVLKVIAMIDNSGISAKKLAGQKWYEIDDIQDLDIATSIFASDDDKRVEYLKKRYGGYWRYPKLLDYCYLVNPYYPPAKMKEEIKASFDILIAEYPSGMEVNSLLAAKNFGIDPKRILVGNGAAELIKSFMNYISDDIVGFIRPTFDEYPNRFPADRSVYYYPQKKDYLYDADDIIRFFGDKQIDSLILINPDNPSGNYIPKKDLFRIADWCGERNIKLVLDESFCDFSDEVDNSMISNAILEKYPNLYVVKSISKSYGVPGLRLGILASGDEKTISDLKKDSAIWNINSFAEFYLQISEKYHSDYVKALERFRIERSRFERELSKVRGIRVIPSQANFIMTELYSDVSPKELLKSLLIKHNLLIKELTTKLNGKNYLRFAVRNSEDNDILIKALKEELGENKYADS